MVSRDFKTLSERRLARAHQLRLRYPASEEVLSFFIALVDFQKQIASQIEKWDSLADLSEPLIALVRKQGPPKLQATALEINKSSIQTALSNYWQRIDTTSLTSFFARVLLQPYLAMNRMQKLQAIDPNRCPNCGHQPQVGMLHPQGDGMAMSLVCSLCSKDWSVRRGTCPACLERREQHLAYYQAPGFDHFQIQVCESCKVYLHTINKGKEPEAIPEVDELAALPLDVWAHQQSYHKLQPNLAGI